MDEIGNDLSAYVDMFTDEQVDQLFASKKDISPEKIPKTIEERRTLVKKLLKEAPASSGTKVASPGFFRRGKELRV